MRNPRSRGPAVRGALAVGITVSLALAVAACAATPPPSPSTASPTPTPGETPAASGGSGAPWVAEGPAAAPFDRAVVPDGTRLDGLIALPDGLLAYGWRQAARVEVGVPSHPTAWRLGTGGAWTAEALPVTAATAAETPNRAVVGDGVVVLAGAGVTSACAHPFGGTSWADDGTGWVQSPVTGGDCLRVAADLAYGAAGFLEVTAASGEVYGAWRSTDGLAWMELPAARGPGRDAQLFGIAATQDGDRYVVVGRGSDGAPTAWETADGNAWRAVPLGAGVDAGAIVAGAGRIAVVMSREGGVAGAWVRTGDGTWTSASAPAGLVGASVTAATGTSDAIVLGGTADGRPVVWVSGDGAAWRAAALDGAGSVRAVAVAGDRLVVLGDLEDAAGDEHSVVWSAPWPLP